MSASFSRYQPNIDPLEPTYFEGESLLAAGKLKEAAALCQNLIMSNPAYPRGYFLLSRIYSHTGNTDKSIEFVNRAIELSPMPISSFHYMRSSYYFAKEQFDMAEEELKLTLKIDPNFSYAALLLGSVYIQKKEYAKAHAFLDEAKKMGLQGEALHQEGILLTAENRKEEAMEVFSRTIKLTPEHALSYIRRGELALMMEWEDVADEDSKMALRLNPQSDEAWKLRAIIASQKKDHVDAIESVQQALRLKPNSTELWRLLGKELYMYGKPSEAIEAYQQVLGRDPEDVFALNSLPTILMGLGRNTEAKEYLEKALINFPDNPVLLHFKAFLDGKTIDKASKEYVENVFDGYAAMFDSHIQEKLFYDIPAIMENALRRTMNLTEKQSATLSFLDLGCGTGLAAKALKQLTKHRVGVDLSSKMIEKAQASGLYDTLSVSDLTLYINDCTETFELLTALDVFVYIGNLSPIFDAARRVMKHGARFAFSVEGDDAAENGFILRSSGRFAHSQEYLRHIAQEYGYNIELIEPAIIRHEAGKPLAGYIAIFSR